ncbi:hypothetical protein I7I50_03555 [Histoplasma capsulatum G186AR]|uniref:Uncharacterized protein n=1 Tax=Ajellomyces capsulatus TaxID=5037 RepID=A0A8H8CX52_AJECA|nr:hypothetical protein I7I52_04462 [Histoplasma capsulatum]QSS74675.1 hypothetical protein I7I50_03555 [Histoplasma capsulatum G186AR]
MSKGTTTAGGPQPYKLDDAMHAIRIIDVGLVHVIAHDDGVGQHPPLLPNAWLILGPQGTQALLVAALVLIPGLFGVVKVHRVRRQPGVHGVADQRVAVGQDPEAAHGGTGGAVEGGELVEAEAAQDGLAAGGGGDGGHFHDILFVPAAPVVKGVDLAAGLVDAVDGAFHVHLVQGVPEGERGVSELVDALG